MRLDIGDKLTTWGEVVGMMYTGGERYYLFLKRDETGIPLVSLMAASLFDVPQDSEKDYE